MRNREAGVTATREQVVKNISPLRRLQNELSFNGSRLIVCLTPERISQLLKSHVISIKENEFALGRRKKDLNILLQYEDI